jgi:hypothetical protein
MQRRGILGNDIIASTLYCALTKHPSEKEQLHIEEGKTSTPLELIRIIHGMPKINSF